MISCPLCLSPPVEPADVREVPMSLPGPVHACPCRATSWTPSGKRGYLWSFGWPGVLGRLEYWTETGILTRNVGRELWDAPLGREAEAILSDLSGYASAAKVLGS